MFNLKTGSFRALEEACVSDVLAARRQDPLAPLLVLSPSGHILTRLQTQLCQAPPLSLGETTGLTHSPIAPRVPGRDGRVQGEGFLNIQFLTFYALAERLLTDIEFGDSLVKESALYREIIHDFLTGKGDVPYTSKDKLIHGGAVPKGLPGALAATLKDLQDSGARVVDCANVAREGHLGDALEDAVPALELNVLLYGVLHKNKLRTSADFIRRAAERARNNSWLKSQKAIYLYGFYDVTGVQLDLIQAVAAYPTAQIYFPYEKDRPGHDYGEKLLDDLRGKSGHVTVLPAPGAAAPEIEAYSCSGTENEVWWAAKQILKQVEAGVPFHKMAVLARALEPYMNSLPSVFEAHCIPYALHAEEPVGAYPLVKTARQALISSSPTAFGGETKDDSWGNHIAWAKARLKNAIRLPETAPAVEKRIWEGLLGALEALAQLDVLGRPVSHERFLEVLDEKLDGLRLQLTSDNLAGVQVLDVMTARGLSFDAVYLLGLNEKLFPRLIREDPFLPDTARSKLTEALGSRIGRKMDGFKEEKLLFELATQSARKHLHLSCQRSDEEGKALVVSLYLHDFLKKRGLMLIPVPRSWSERVQNIATAILTPKEISIAFHRENQNPQALYKGLGWDRGLLTHLLESQKEMEAFGTLGAHDGLIGVDNSQTRAILDAGLSPGTLRDLAQCPFKVFARKVLELYTEEGDVEDGQITHAGRGKLIHKILQTFYENKSDISSLEIVANEQFKLFHVEYSDLYPLAWQAEKTRILDMLKRFIPLDMADQAATGFKPAYFETPVEGEINGIKLQGRVDRVDMSTSGFRVVDYKTGRLDKDNVNTQILKGKAFQLPVYLALAKTLLEIQKKPAAKEGEAVFYHLEQDDATEEPLRIGPDFWKEHGEQFYRTLAFLVKDIETGAFYIRPSDTRGYCDWCDYKAVCRKEHKPTQIRAKDSPFRKKHEEAFTLPK